jgi:hypothetical protein
MTAVFHIKKDVIRKSHVLMFKFLRKGQIISILLLAKCVLIIMCGFLVKFPVSHSPGDNVPVSLAKIKAGIHLQFSQRGLPSSATFCVCKMGILKKLKIFLSSKFFSWIGHINFRLYAQLSHINGLGIW